MREIKFRAWDKREGLQRMIYIDAFVPYGEGWHGGNPEYKFYELYLSHNGFMKVAFKEVEIMQFTGLKDKNGKEIYEGDIVKFHTDYENSNDEFNYTEEPTTVEWNNNVSGFWPFYLNARWRCDVCDIEIVGNIYEQPNKLIQKI